jgi:hypothetical protein
MAHAKAAMEIFTDVPEMRAFMDAIDPASISVSHFEMVSS